MKKKIAFTTCVQLGLSCIEEIYKIGGKLDLLITLKDEKAKNKSGRIYLDEVAERENAPLLKINNINDPKVIEALKEHEIDWLFIIGWSQIAKKEVIETPINGCIGMHPTLLPVGRGRAAIPWAIIKGKDKTGVTMFKLDEGVDTGDIIGQDVIKINENTTATDLYKKVDEMHVELIAKYWDDIVNDRVVLKKQDESKATEWSGRKPDDGELLSSMKMDEADKLVRAVTHPYPGAFYKDRDKVIRIWSAKVDPDEGEIKLSDGYLTPIDYENEG
ncbi:methionyl-tRNA formyltransferase [Vallitalea pronyensis]|uniref:Methionyl-tRNA formyltransferase n=1 Tax=Vallitalea pronyensis TaxID=1348613 RepID=A0A8J8MPJ6_9FIRM|nr:formyltransferase family protein [Vallitalea pronyensis]QUI25013.1 methionyl-tRNA formyltransferase [Vallitalea pronyensis]